MKDCKLMILPLVIVLASWALAGCGGENASATYSSDDALPVTPPPHSGVTPGLAASDNCRNSDTLQINVTRPDRLINGEFSLQIYKALSSGVQLIHRGPPGYANTDLSFSVDNIGAGKFIVEIRAEGLKFIREIVTVGGFGCQPIQKSLKYKMEMYSTPGEKG